MSSPTEKTRKERTVRSAREKCQAVLALWTGRRRPSEICRELQIPANLLSGWQERALEGMLQALEPRTRQQEERGPLLAPRLERLLERKLARTKAELERLRQRVRIREVLAGGKTRAKKKRGSHDRDPHPPAVA